jgi:CRP-like cAMP-binding protein
MVAHSLPLTENQFLAGLPDECLEKLRPSLRRIMLESGEGLRNRRGESNFAYFPAGCVMHLVLELADGSGSEILMVGREGFCGSSLAPEGLDDIEACVIEGGEAFVVPNQAFVDIVNSNAQACAMVLENMQRSYLQTARIAACNRRHRLDQQLCRWLLMFTERSGSNEVRLTQECISLTLGVRREGISHAFRMLEEKGVVRCRRGRATILDFDALAEHACDCFEKDSAFSEQPSTASVA